MDSIVLAPVVCGAARSLSFKERILALLAEWARIVAGEEPRSCRPFLTAWS